MFYPNNIEPFSRVRFLVPLFPRIAFGTININPPSTDFPLNIPEAFDAFEYSELNSINTTAKKINRVAEYRSNSGVQPFFH